MSRSALAYGKLPGIHHLTESLALANPYPFYANLARLGPLFWDQEAKLWICTGYKEAEFILRDPQAHFGLSRFRSTEQLLERGLDSLVPAYMLLHPHMVLHDDPLHNQIRAALHIHLKKVMESTFPAAIQALAEEQLSPFLHEQYRIRMDLVDDFAGILPTKAVALLLGLPLEDVGHFLRWNRAYDDALACLVGPVQLRRPAQNGMLEALEEALRYFQYLVQARLDQPQDDLMSDLLHSLRPISSHYAPEELINTIAAYCMLLLSGGYATATNLLVQTLFWLDKKPDLRRLLEEEPGVLEDIVRETGRLSSPCQYTTRLAVADSVISGKRIRRGQTVVVLIAAANRDEQAFPYSLEWSLSRQGMQKPLALTLGRHSCLETPYADLTVRTALQTFLRLFPDVRFAPEEELEWAGSLNARYPLHVPIIVASSQARAYLTEASLHLAIPEDLSAHLPERASGWQNDLIEVLTLGEGGVIIRYDPKQVKLSLDLQQGVLLAHKVVEAREPSTDELPSKPSTQGLPEIFARVLSLEHIDEQSDFFDAGGDSLAILTLLMEIEKRFQVTLDPVTIYDHPRLGDLATHIAQQQETQESAPEREAVHS